MISPDVEEFIKDKPNFQKFIKLLPSLLDDFFSIKDFDITLGEDWEYGTKEIVCYLGLENLTWEEIAKRNQNMIAKIEMTLSPELIDAYDNIIFMFKERKV